LSQHNYLNIFLSNETKRDLRFCLDNRSYCETVKAGKSISTFGTDATESDRKLEEWLGHLQLEVCGKTLPLQQLRPVSAFDKADDGTDVTYNAKLTERDLAPACGGKSG